MATATTANLNPVRAQSKQSALKRREAFEGFLFISPWLIGFLVFFLGPLIATFIISFTEWNIVTDPIWVGLRNYEQIFTNDPDFIKSLQVTFTFAIIYLPLSTIVGIGVGLALNAKVRGIGIFRMLFYLPSVAPSFAAALIWVWILNPRYGLLNTVLSWFGVKGPNWLADPDTALWGIVMITLWGVGASAVIYLAGLQNIPQQLYEAAQVDGATPLQQFWYVTLPSLTPTIFFQLVIGLIGVFQIFTSAFAATVTLGGPQKSTFFYMLYIYSKGWVSLRMGYAAALAWILTLIILAITVLVFRSSPYWVHYEAERK